MTALDHIHRLQTQLDQARYEKRLLVQKLERRDARIDRLYRQLRHEQLRRATRTA
jgi:hypothetical protein